MIVVEYHVEGITPEVAAEIGRLVRDRLVADEIAGATFIAAHAAFGSAAYRIVEQLPPRH